jgi:GNAT superfamily N-acetyltransferase
MTATELLPLKRATPDELPDVLDLLDEVAAWLRDRGVEQWPERFSGLDNWRLERLHAYVKAGETYLLRDTAGDPVATLTWTLKADPDYAAGWPDGPLTGTYVHRMAVRRRHAGQRIGTQLLDWADAQTVDAGRRWLRLDCSRTNRPLQQYYERHGFQRVGEIVADIDYGGIDQPTGEIYRRASGALYQRPAGWRG